MSSPPIRPSQPDPIAVAAANERPFNFQRRQQRIILVIAAIHFAYLTWEAIYHATFPRTAATPIMRVVEFFVGWGSYIALGGAFLLWLFRAAENARDFGSKTDSPIDPPWVVLHFFIPIVNLLRPLQSIAQIWRASEPLSPDYSPGAWRSKGVPAFIPMWWILWTIFWNTYVLTSIAVKRGAISPIRFHRITAAHDIVGIFALALMLMLIEAINTRQEQFFKAQTSVD